MKRILCIVSNLNQGGAETFLMKILRNIDRTEYMLDFCVMRKEKGIYEEEVIALGGKVFYILPKSESFLKCFSSIKNIVQKNNYKYVIRVNEHSLSVLDLIAAKIGGAKKLIMRSSNSISSSKKRIMLHKIFSFLPKIIPNVKMAPSGEAAEYTFGKGCVKKGKVCILENGISYEDYAYGKDKRETKRKELDLENKFVVGHIGRFQMQKNHKFLIDVFSEIYQRNSAARLILVGGNGELLEDIKRKVKDLKLDEAVLFLGNRKDVGDLLCAMDVLLFPSLFEGMPNVIIEAQAAGLRCIVSDTITREADITGLVKYISLKASFEKWAEETVEFGTNYERKDKREDFVSNGYDIQTVVSKFTKLVFND